MLKDGCAVSLPENSQVTPNDDEPQSFVLRARLVRSPVASLPGYGTGDDLAAGELQGAESLSTPPRLHIRVEHVNTAEISQHHSIDNALSWLRVRLNTLLDRAASTKTSAPDQTGH